MGGGGYRVHIAGDDLDAPRTHYTSGQGESKHREQPDSTDAVQRLTIRRAVPTDAGVYKCVVWNSHGSAATAARVYLESTPFTFHF